MRALTIVASTCVAVLLAACAGPAYRSGGGGYGPGGPTPPVAPAPSNPLPPAPGARVVGYICEDLTRITIVEGQPGAKAKLNSGLELSLAHTGAGRYGVPPIEFRTGASGGQWLNNGRVWPCRLG